MRFSFALSLISLLATSVSAGETSWQEIAPGVQIRLIGTGKIKPDGTTLVGLEIDMPANTKTYWRIPGDTGLPTDLDFSGSDGVKGHTIHWPYPTRDQTTDYLDYVYYGPTVLPIELDLAPDAKHLELSAVLGVCSDICIPAQASFSMQLLNAQPDMPNGLRLKQALADAPIAWPHDEAAFGDVSFDGATGELHIPVLSPAIELSSLIVTSPSGEPLFGTPQKSPEPNLVTVPVMSENTRTDWSTQAVQLTFMTDMGAFEITQPVIVAAGEP